MGIKVVKFGGSSLADAKQFKKVADIIKADAERRYVVPSAPGKRFKEDDKVTDLLYKSFENAGKPEFEEVFGKIRERYSSIVEELGVELDLEAELRDIETCILNKAGRDFAASRGEYLNAKILSKYLGYEFIDAAEVVFFNDDGTLDAEKTNTVLSERLEETERAVIPGFYGSMPNHTIKTFSRGGSDISGAIVARAAQADVYENWTDVSGFLICDPRIVENPAPIELITYRELRELSYMGATVLHEDSIFPVKVAGIPIEIKNTNAPQDKGTRIVASCRDTNKDMENVITGIAGKKGFSVVTLEKDMMNEEVGFGKKVLEVLSKYNLCFEHLPSGIDTMGLVLDGEKLLGYEDDLIADLFAATASDSINIENNISLIAVVGRKMRNAHGTAARVFNSLAKAGINIRLIDQGSSELNIIIGVDTKDFEGAIKAIYSEFVK